jgi:hypothetical protein
MLRQREEQMPSLKVSRLISAARSGLARALTTERKAPARAPTTQEDFAAIAEAVRGAALPEGLPDNLFDLSETDREEKLEAANQALEAASLAFTRAALR